MLAYDRSSTGLWVALIFLVSLNLRPAIAAVGPVLAQMGTDLAWGEGVQGVLTAIPLIAFAAVSPLVTFLARRIGIDMSILLALLCIAAGDFARSFGGGVGIWLGTVVFASAIAVGNVLVPVIAKRDYAGHVAMATGVYSGCITAGSATAGLLSAPLAQMWGGWRASLAFWSVPPLVVAALWALRILHNRKVVIASAGGTIETSDTGDIDDIGDRQHDGQRTKPAFRTATGMFHAIVAWRVHPRAAPSDDVVRDGLHGAAIIRLLHHVQLDAVHLRIHRLRRLHRRRASVHLPRHRHPFRLGHS